MTYLEFYRAVLWRAFEDGIGWTKSIIFLGVLLAGFVTKSVEFAFLLFCVLVVFDLSSVLHSMWQEEHDARTKAEAALQSSSD
jgi:hypothetical protein